MTGKTPFELLMGFTPQIHDVAKKTNLPELEQRTNHLKLVREQVQNAIKCMQQMTVKYGQRRKGQCHFKPYKEGKMVWLEATNLKLSQPKAKLGT
jgi:hypothetical protein